MFKSGFVAIIGRPNVGKSTLLNLLIGEKAAIISDKPQTTRNRIRGILTTADFQAVFIDTPGIHKPQHKLGEHMVKTALDTLKEVDLVLFLADASTGPGKGDDYIIEALRQVDTPVILVLNKADLVQGSQVTAFLEIYRDKYPFAAALPVSALTGYNKVELLRQIVSRLEEGPKYYPDDVVTDQPERFIVAEIIREKILHLTREEIPHSVGVEIETYKMREDGLLHVGAIIYVERESQKKIIIGKGGSLLKEVGTLARQEIEALMGARVFLEMWVKVRRDWRNRENTWKSMGLGLEKE